MFARVPRGRTPKLAARDSSSRSLRVVEHLREGRARGTLMGRVTPSNSVPAYSVDSTRLPLVVVRPTARVLVDLALDTTYALLERVLELDTPILFLFDLRGGTSSPKRRQRLRIWQEARKEQLERNIQAMAIVVGSQLERGFVTAALWISTPAYPMRVFTELRDGEAWLLAIGARGKTG